MQAAVLTGWKDFYEEGKQYNSLVKGALKKPEKFTPEIIYNIAAMAIEKYFMAYFIKGSILPPNHTLLDLVDYMKQHEELPEDLEKRLLYMNDFQEICSIEHYERKTPSLIDLAYFSETVDQVFLYIESRI